MIGCYLATQVAHFIGIFTFMVLRPFLRTFTMRFCYKVAAFFFWAHLPYSPHPVLPQYIFSKYIQTCSGTKAQWGYLFCARLKFPQQILLNFKILHGICNVGNCLRPEEYMVSVDHHNAYWHVLTCPLHQHFLYFTIADNSFQFVQATTS